jgi:hypothetical protein
MMRKLLLIAILLVGSLSSGGALDFQEFALTAGGRSIVALARDDGYYQFAPEILVRPVSVAPSPTVSRSTPSIGIRRTAAIACGSMANGSSYLTMQW